MNYDSKAEEATAKKYEKLGFLRQPQFDGDYTFADPKGEAFRALPDRYNAKTGLYIDEKYAPLNHKTSRATAKRAFEAEKARFDAGLSQAKSPTSYQVKHGWNYATAKQRAVQIVLGPAQYVPCFEQPISPDDLMYYYSKGLRVCTRKSLPSYNAWAALSKAGVPCEFRLHSDDGKSDGYEEWVQKKEETAAQKRKAARPLST